MCPESGVRGTILNLSSSSCPRPQKSGKSRPRPVLVLIFWEYSSSPRPRSVLVPSSSRLCLEYGPSEDMTSNDLKIVTMLSESSKEGLNSLIWKNYQLEHKNNLQSPKLKFPENHGIDETKNSKISISGWFNFFFDKMHVAPH